MSEEKETHTHTCCGGHPHEHYENPFEVELARQIDEYLKNRGKTTLAQHEEDCHCCETD